MNELNRIVNHLILNSPYINDIGLYNGKMGICIFFFHYARWKGENIYTEFAHYLLKQIWKDVTAYTPINLQDGLCGIGWSIEYLNQQRFVEIDTNEILEEVDTHIMIFDPMRTTDNSISTGLEGVLYYWLCRIRNYTQEQVYPFDKNYYERLLERLSRKDFQFENPFIQKQYLNYFIKKQKIDFSLFIPFTQKDGVLSDSIRDYSLGLQNGLAGIGLNKIRHEASLSI